MKDLLSTNFSSSGDYISDKIHQAEPNSVHENSKQIQKSKLFWND